MNNILVEYDIDDSNKVIINEVLNEIKDSLDKDNENSIVVKMNRIKDQLDNDKKTQF